MVKEISEKIGITPFRHSYGGSLPFNLQKIKLKFGMLPYVNPGGQNLWVVKIFEGQNFCGSKFVGVQKFLGLNKILGQN